MTKHVINVIIQHGMTIHSFGQRSGQRDRALAWGVGLLLFAIYLLSYRGGFHSIDEVSMFAVTESLVKFGNFNTDQIAWTQWTTSQREAQGFFGLDGHVYSKKGLAMSLALAPLYWLGLTLPGLGMLQTASLLNVVITAATGSLLVCLVRRLGFERRIALGIALLYGLATIAWVYSKYLFSEPLAGLLLLATAYCLVVFGRQGGNWRPIVAGLLAGLAVATRANNLFLVPVFGAYLLAASRPQTSVAVSRSPARPSLLPVAGYALGLIPPALMLMGYNWMRAGNPWQTGYDLTIFSTTWLTGLYKLLFSPLRGLFLYSPVLILSLPGLAWLWSRQRAEAALIAGVAGVTSLLFSVWTSGEGLSWGSRFLVPVVPFLCLALAPALDRALAGSKVLAGALAGLAALSAAIQFLGVAINPWVYLARLQADLGEFFLEKTPALNDLRYHQAIGQLQSWSLANSDLAWWQPWGLDVIALGLCLILLVIAAVNLKSPIANPAILAIPTLLVTYALLARYFISDRQFGPLQDSYTRALAAASARAEPGETLVSVAPYHYHVPMNRFKARLPILGFAQSATPLPETAWSLLRRNLSGDATTLVTVGLAPAAPDNPVEAWLASHAFKAGDEWIENARWVRYGLGQPTLTRPIDITLGQELRLVGVTLEPSRQPGQILPVEFSWAPLRQPGADYNLFLQLLTSDGRLVAEHDGPPVGGYAPTSGWSPGALVSDRHGLALPSDLSPETYRLIAGLVDPANGQRLTTAQGADFVELGPIHLESSHP